jgi:hypothetical protein
VDVCDSLPASRRRARASFRGMKHGHRLRAGNGIRSPRFDEAAQRPCAVPNGLPGARCGAGGLQARAYAAWLAAAIFNTVGSFYLPRPALCPNEAGGARFANTCRQATRTHSRSSDPSAYFVVRSGNLAASSSFPENPGPAAVAPRASFPSRAAIPGLQPKTHCPDRPNSGSCSGIGPQVRRGADGASDLVSCPLRASRADEYRQLGQNR